MVLPVLLTYCYQFMWVKGQLQLSVYLLCHLLILFLPSWSYHLSSLCSVISCLSFCEHLFHIIWFLLKILFSVLKVQVDLTWLKIENSVCTTLFNPAHLRLNQPCLNTQINFLFLCKSIVSALKHKKPFFLRDLYSLNVQKRIQGTYLKRLV